jgi:hypothetical protein
MGVLVRLNVYDLSPQNQYTYWAGVGIFHTGVEVYGIEYAYGGHDYDVSGIFATNPRQAPGAGEAGTSTQGREFNIMPSDGFDFSQIKAKSVAALPCFPPCQGDQRLPAPAVKFRESICVGETNLSQMELQQLIQKFGEQYKGNRYHLLQKNCNHFASDLCFQLVGKTAPSWVSFVVLFIRTSTGQSPAFCSSVTPNMLSMSQQPSRTRAFR